MKLAQTAQSIHSLAMDIVRRYKNCEVELIEILEQVDAHRVYLTFGYSSLFKYATQALGLSAEVAYIFINVSRKGREVPALKEAIKDGTITVSKAKKITSVLNSKNQSHWLELAKSAPKRELERQVAAVSPSEAVREKMDYVHPELEIKDKVSLVSLAEVSDEARLGLQSSKPISHRVQLQVGISEKLMLKLRRAQDLLSQKNKKAIGMEDVLEVIVSQYLLKEDPLEKAKRQKMRGKIPAELIKPIKANEVKVDEVKVDEVRVDEMKAEEKMGSSRPSMVIGRPFKVSSKGAMAKNKILKTRRPLTALLRHQLTLKHNSCCSYIDASGNRCSERRFLEVHHIKPVSKGGGNELSNLKLLCAGHHRMIHWNSHNRVERKIKEQVPGPVDR